MPDEIVSDELGLYNHPKMLLLGDPAKVTIQTDHDKGRDQITLATSYGVAKAWTESTGATYLALWTRAAYELMLIRRREDGVITIMMIEKLREVAAMSRGNTVTKLPGGYDQSGKKGSRQYLSKRIYKEMGIQVAPEDMNFFGNPQEGYQAALGHGTIHTPIALGWATKWLLDKNWSPIDDSVKPIEVPLETAVKWCINAVTRAPDAIRVEDETSFEGIMTLDYLIRNNQITI